MEHGSGLDRLFMQCVIRRQAFIFVRKTLSVRLRDQKMRSIFYGSEGRNGVFR